MSRSAMSATIVWAKLHPDQPAKQADGRCSGRQRSQSGGASETNERRLGGTVMEVPACAVEQEGGLRPPRHARVTQRWMPVEIAGDDLGACTLALGDVRGPRDRGAVSPIPRGDEIRRPHRGTLDGP